MCWHVTFAPSKWIRYRIYLSVNVYFSICLNMGGTWANTVATKHVSGCEEADTVEGRQRHKPTSSLVFIHPQSWDMKHCILCYSVNIQLWAVSQILHRQYKTLWLRCCPMKKKHMWYISGRFVSKGDQKAKQHKKLHQKYYKSNSIGRRLFEHSLSLTFEENTGDIASLKQGFNMAAKHICYFTKKTVL